MKLWTLVGVRGPRQTSSTVYDPGREGSLRRNWDDVEDEEKTDRQKGRVSGSGPRVRTRRVQSLPNNHRHRSLNLSRKQTERKV